jgi:poly(hydroxyalkanoate) depolymerase family esterase
MPLIDWQELYASNRAVIQRALPGAPLDPPAASARAWRSASAGDLPRSPAARRPPGAGIFDKLDPVPGAQGRDVFVHTPPGLDASSPAPLVVMLHGCTQTAASFAAATGMNAAADRHGFVVAHAQQSREHNQQGCWNWFTSAHQRRGAGEPAFIASAARAIAQAGSRWAIDEDRVFVAGFSAGGAMASVVAATYPDVFAAAAIHSGLAYGSAHGLPAALTAMTRGGQSPDQQGRAALEAMGPAARVVPVISIHGTADPTVCPVNGDQVLRQWMATNRLASAGTYTADAARPAGVSSDRTAGGRAHTRRTWTDATGALVQEHVEVEGMGHAWSGGAAGASYTDPAGPSATELVWSFFERVRPRVARPPREPAGER